MSDASRPKVARTSLGKEIHGPSLAPPLSSEFLFSARKFYQRQLRSMGDHQIGVVEQGLEGLDYLRVDMRAIGQRNLENVLDRPQSREGLRVGKEGEIELVELFTSLRPSRWAHQTRIPGRFVVSGNNLHGRSRDRRIGVRSELSQDVDNLLRHRRCC